MERKSKIMLLAGVVAGAASAYYLTTPKGKELRSKLANKAKDVADLTNEKASEVSEIVKDKVTSMKASLSETKEAVTEKATDAAVNQLGNLEEGIAKAKSRLQNGVTL